MKISMEEYSARLAMFNRLAVPFEMILDLDSPVADLRTQLVAVKDEAYMAKYPSFNAFCSEITFLLAWGYDLQSSKKRAGACRDLLFRVCRLTQADGC